MAQAAPQSNPAAVNAQLRAALLATAPRMRKNVGTFTNALGTTSRIKLFNVGVVTMLQIAVTATVTIGVANAIASPKGPWNLINKLRITDYDGTDRVNLSGFQLFQVNSVRYREPFGWNNSGMSALITNPQQPLAVGNQTVRFLINIPIAYDPENDLRGAILAQTAVGEMYLNIDWNSAFVGATDDFPYNNATVPTNTVVSNGTSPISVQVWQHYLLPQAIGKNGQIPLPPLDLMTVYELAGAVISSDNIAANAERLFNYPNVRTVIGAYFSYMNGTTLAAVGDTSQHRIIANGNNILRDETELSKYFNQRLYTHGDIARGVFYNLHRDKPIETALFGNVQNGITPASVGANSYFESMYESFYTKGTTLPGMQQAGG